MRKTTQRKLDQLDVHLQQLLDKLKEYEEADLHRSREDEWSVLQVMHHLYLSEKLSSGYIRKKAQAEINTLPSANLLSTLRAEIVGFYLRTPIKWKAPKVVDSPQFPEELEFWSLARAWRADRKALRQWLEELPKEYHGKQLYKHPLGGRMGINGMLSFFDRHFRRHRAQIMRRLPY